MMKTTVPKRWKINTCAIFLINIMYFDYFNNQIIINCYIVNSLKADTTHPLKGGQLRATVQYKLLKSCEGVSLGESTVSWFVAENFVTGVVQRHLHIQVL